MFNSASRNPGIDLDRLIQMFGAQGDLGLPSQAAQPGRINPAGMEKNADGTSSFPSAPPQLNPRGTAGMFAAGRQVAPVNSVAMPNGPMVAPRFTGFAPIPPATPPDQLFGTNPIGVSPLAQQLPQDPAVRKATAPRFFDKNGAWRDVLGGLADAMAAAGGGKPTYFPAKIEQQKRQQEQSNWQAEQEAKRQQFAWQMRKDSRPEVRTVNGQVVSVPFEGDPSVIYSAPTDGEQYAASLGLSEGDDGYADAVMDFTLRGNGPTAYGQRRQLEDQRQGNRIDLRGRPTYANLHPRTGGGGGRGNGGAPRPPASVSAAVAPLIAKLASGQPLSAGEQQALAYYNRGGGRGGKPLPINPAGPAPIPPRPAAPRLPTRHAGPVRVSTPDEARRLKPGTPFITPDGQQKVR